MSDTQKAGPEPVRMRQPSPEEIAMMKASQERAVVEQKKARLIGVAATILSGMPIHENDSDVIMDENTNTALNYAVMIIKKVDEHFSTEGK